MPEPIAPEQFAGPHPTCSEFVVRLKEWGFQQGREEGVHIVFRGPHGGKLKVIRSQLGRADPDMVDRAAKLADVTPAQFWAGPGEPLAPMQDTPHPSRAARRRLAHRDSVTSLVLAIHARVDRPLGFDQVVDLAAGQVTRSQVSAASSALCRDGQLDRIRSGVYQWSGGQRAAVWRVPAPRQGHAPVPPTPPGQGESVSASALLGQLFPSGVPLTTEALADLEEWARLTGKLAAHGTVPGR